MRRGVGNKRLHTTEQTCIFTAEQCYLALRWCVDQRSLRWSDVEVIEKWMVCFPDLDDMSIDDMMDFLNVALTEERP